MSRLIYNADVKHNTRGPKNAANTPKPGAIVFVPIQQQALLTVVSLALWCIKGIFFGSDDLALDKIAGTLNDTVVQQVVAASVGETVLEWENLCTLKIRERRKQKYLSLKYMCMNLPTQ